MGVRTRRLGSPEGAKAFILAEPSENVQGQGVLGCYSFTRTSQADDKTPEEQ